MWVLVGEKGTLNHGMKIKVISLIPQSKCPHLSESFLEDPY
jgi:hypothetical protein